MIAPNQKVQYLIPGSHLHTWLPIWPPLHTVNTGEKETRFPTLIFLVLTHICIYSPPFNTGKHPWINTPKLKLINYMKEHLFHQSRQITGSGTVPDMVQVYRIRNIQSHNASGKPKLFLISNCQIRQKYKFLLQVFTIISFCTPKITTQNIKQCITVFIKYFWED